MRRTILRGLKVAAGPRRAGALTRLLVAVTLAFVAFVPASAEQTLGAPVTLMSGFQDARGGRWGRPTDAVAGPDGAVYVADDQAGAVYRIGPAWERAAE